jgi:hypothetical protein
MEEGVVEEHWLEEMLWLEVQAMQLLTLVVVEAF